MRRFGDIEQPRCFRGYCAICLVAAACSTAGTSSRATVDQYLIALRSNSPHDAYDLLSTEARRRTRFDQFAHQWKLSASERAWQAQALEAGIHASPGARERARVVYPDGNVMYLQREGPVWRVETEFANRSNAKQPRDAIERFADAIAHRDIGAALDMLTRRRRDAIAKQIDGFISGLGQHIDVRLDHFGPDRAELRWDDRDFRYRVMLQREAGQWRIDDIYIRPTPLRDASSADSESEDAIE